MLVYNTNLYTIMYTNLKFCQFKSEECPMKSMKFFMSTHSVVEKRFLVFTSTCTCELTIENAIRVVNRRYSH